MGTLAALHDVLEKGTTTINSMTKEFGIRIANGVRGISRVLPNEEGDDNKIEKPVEEYFEDSFEKRGDMLIKGCDREVNWETIDTLLEDKKPIILPKYIKEHFYFEEGQKDMPSNLLINIRKLIKDVQNNEKYHKYFDEKNNYLLNIDITDVKAYNKPTGKTTRNNRGNTKILKTNSRKKPSKVA